MALDLRIASPCTADWDGMAGDDRSRHCAQCNLSVYNFAELTRAEIEELVATREGRLCARLYRRADGTMITKDCPVGFQMKVRRISRIAGVALVGAMAIPMIAQVSASPPQAPVQAVSHGADVHVFVTDPTGAVIRNASVTLINSATQNKYKLSTDLHGQAAFPDVSAGTYRMEIVSKGFRNFNDSFPVSAGETVSIETSLVLGSMGGTMVIETTAPLPAPFAARSTSLVVAVIDATDTAVANAKVTLMNESTRTRIEQKSDGRGGVRFLDLPAATYTVEVVALGFRTVKKTNLQLGPGQVSGLEVLLPLGESVFFGEVTGK